MKCVKEKDKGTLQYDWFFNDDNSVCIVREHYKDSDAVLEHIGNLAELFGKLLSAPDLSLEVFGNPSEKLQNATAGMDIKVYSPF